MVRADDVESNRHPMAPVADMRRERWVRVETRWRVMDSHLVWVAVLSLVWALLNALVAWSCQDRIHELEAQVQRLQGRPVRVTLPSQSEACGVVRDVGSPYIRTHVTNQMGTLVYTCGNETQR